MTPQFIRRNNLAFFCYDWLEALEQSMGNEITLANIAGSHTIQIKDAKTRTLKYNLTRQLKALKSARIALKHTITDLRIMTRSIDHEQQLHFGETSDELFSVLELIYQKADENPDVIEKVKNLLNNN
jgi:hypothetical protein